MGLIVLAKNVSFVAAAGQRVYGEWIRVDSEHKLANTHVHCQTLSPLGGTTGITVAVQTSFDTVESSQVGTNTHMTSPGSSDDPIGATLADHVRLVLANMEAFTVMGIVSVWLELEE